MGDPEILLKRYLDGTLGEAERKKLADWFLALPEDKATAYFDRFSEAIDGMDEIRLRELEDRLRAATENPENVAGTPWRLRKLWTGWKVAASVILLAGLSYLFIQYRKAPRTGEHKQIRVEKANQRGERTKLTLEDGTIVWLNAESSLHFPEKFEKGSREVYLEGEAFFEVSRDEERPFLIHSGDVLTKVLGTSFNVNAYPDHPMVVTVNSGKVYLTDTGDNAVYLEAGQQTSFVPDQGFSAAKQVNAAEYSDWTRGTLNLNNKSLAEAALLLERWYNVDIRLTNKNLENCVIAGEHTNESLGNVLEALRFVFHIDYIRRDGEVVISGKGCP